MNDSYLIPANSKRSMLILSLFAPIDIAIFGSGVVLTIILLVVFNSSINGIKDIIMVILPALITGVMVAPVPNHRNVWQLTVHIYNYFINKRSYCWKGWCFNDGKQTK